MKSRMTLSTILFSVKTELPLVLSFPALQQEAATDHDSIDAMYAQIMPLIAGRLLAVDTPVAFEAALDEMLSDPLVAEAYALLSDVGLSAPLPTVAGTAQLRPEVAQYLGTAAAEHLAAHRAHLIGQIRSVEAVVDEITPEVRAQVAAPRPLDWFITDETISIPEREMALHWTYGALCAVVGGYCILQRHRVADWLGLLLAERIISGAELFVRYIASMPGSPLSDMVPTKKRLPLAQYAQDHREAQWGMRLSFLQMRASQQAIRCPFGAASDVNE